MRLRPPGKESSNEKAETENRIAVWTGVHDLLLYGTDNVLVDFVGKIACLPMRLLESDRLLAVRALCHMAYRTGLFTVSFLAERHGVSRKTLYKWIERFEMEGVAGLEDQMRRPRWHPNQTSEEVEAAIAEFRRKHPD